MKTREEGMIFFLGLFLSLTWLSSSAQAEYRVFKLQISSTNGTESRTVLSTLDPDQYRGYYTVKDTERIFYTDTWMCRERTNEQPLCPNPKEAGNQTGVLDTPEAAPPPPTAPTDSTRTPATPLNSPP